MNCSHDSLIPPSAHPILLFPPNSVPPKGLWGSFVPLQMPPQWFGDHLSSQTLWGSFVPHRVCGDHLSPRVWESFVPPEGLGIICPHKWIVGSFVPLQMPPKGFVDHLSPQTVWGSVVPQMLCGIICSPCGRRNDSQTLLGTNCSPRKIAQ